jgi:hypothetical protein
MFDRFGKDGLKWYAIDGKEHTYGYEVASDGTTLGIEVASDGLDDLGNVDGIDKQE